MRETLTVRLIAGEYSKDENRVSDDPFCGSPYRIPAECCLCQEIWSRRSDLNRRPADYEASASESRWTSTDVTRRFAERSRPLVSVAFATRPSTGVSDW